jgi:hypothetical protein
MTGSDFHATCKMSNCQTVAGEVGEGKFSFRNLSGNLILVLTSPVGLDPYAYFT